MSKRTLLQKAHTFRPAKDNISAWLCSEKLDGHRAFWDGGLSRGLLKSKVGWANHTGDKRYLTPPIATGLWSQLGNVIHAPPTFLNDLPRDVPLDGELYTSHGHRQEIASTIKKLEPILSEWAGIKLHCFDIPPYHKVLAPGTIEWQSGRKDYQLTIDRGTFDLYEAVYHCQCDLPYAESHKKLLELQNYFPSMQVVPQVRLSSDTPIALAEVELLLEEVSEAGGEGLILRDPKAFYSCTRSHSLLKVKKLQDAEATVIGLRTGYRTEKDSRHLGRMGALLVRTATGVEFELSGFTDKERQLIDGNDEQWACEHPGKIAPSWIDAWEFPKDTIITYRYRGTTRDGVPTEARYWRKREEL